MLNVGPRPDGTLDPKSVERLEGIGEWLAKYGDSIFGTRGGPIQPQPWGVSTESSEVVYLHILDTSKADDDGWLTLSGTGELNQRKVGPMAGDQPIETRTNADGLLEAKVGKDQDEVDVILVVTK